MRQELLTMNFLQDKVKGIQTRFRSRSSSLDVDYRSKIASRRRHGSEAPKVENTRPDALPIIDESSNSWGPTSEFMNSHYFRERTLRYCNDECLNSWVPTSVLLNTHNFRERGYVGYFTDLTRYEY